MLNKHPKKAQSGAQIPFLPKFSLSKALPMTYALQNWRMRPQVGALRAPKSEFKTIKLYKNQVVKNIQGICSCKFPKSINRLYLKAQRSPLPPANETSKAKRNAQTCPLCSAQSRSNFLMRPVAHLATTSQKSRIMFGVQLTLKSSPANCKSTNGSAGS